MPSPELMDATVRAGFPLSIRSSAWTEDAEKCLPHRSKDAEAGIAEDVEE